MKTLQNNFTTPEQSKRLLEMGVPKDSADCYYVLYKDLEDYEILVRTKGDTGNAFFKVVSYIPCWSVGRLIEIMNICSIHNIVSIYRTDRDVTQIDIILETIINRINGNSIDFSKLE